MKELSEFRRDMLFAIAGYEPATSSDVRGELEDLGYSISTGRLYSSLGDLVDSGYIVKEADGRSNIYRVSESGVSELVSRREWESEAVANL